ncbi:putative transposase [Shigella flexneri 4343-70]|nr:putative transposase [Shigella flexneri 4343-70]
MFPDFFMHIGQALDLVSRYDSLRNPLTSLGDYLDPELISRCLAESGTVTLTQAPSSPRNDGLVYCWHGA